MTRRWIYLALVLAVALALAAFEARSAEPAAESAQQPEEGAAAPGQQAEAGSDACNRCDARQKDKARLREELKTLRGGKEEEG